MRIKHSMLIVEHVALLFHHRVHSKAREIKFHHFAFRVNPSSRVPCKQPGVIY